MTPQQKQGSGELSPRAREMANLRELVERLKNERDEYLQVVSEQSDDVSRSSTVKFAYFAHT